MGKIGKISLIIYALVHFLTSNAQINVIGSTAQDGNYLSLRAAFLALNGASQIGRTIELQVTSSTVETASASLNAGGWSSFVIYPTTSGLSVSGTIAAAGLIDLNGADNVTIDGRVNRTGTIPDLSIINLSTVNTTATSTIRFINDASNNNIQYCVIKGATSATTGGVVYLGAGTSTGNDNNTITQNYISGISATLRPVSAVYSYGAAALLNDGLTVSSNNIFDFMSLGLSSYGVNLNDYTNGAIVTDNSFYETTNYSGTATNLSLYVIYMSTTTGSGFQIKRNKIGGQAPDCGGGAWTKTNTMNNTFNGILCGVATTTNCQIEENQIANINWSNNGTGTFSGIYMLKYGGTVSNNSIGSEVSANSIIFNANGTATFRGIFKNGTGDVDIVGNKIGAVLCSNTNQSNNVDFYGVYVNLAGTCNVTNNTIGSNTVSNSVVSSSGSLTVSQIVAGIYSFSSNIVVNNNVIANLNNSCTSATASSLYGIYCGAASTITGNTIHDLLSMNASTATYSTVGIVCNAAAVQTITQNQIYNISNTYTGYTGRVLGIHFTGTTTASTISENFIHSLSAPNASASAIIAGLSLTNTYVASNNIVSIGDNSSAIFYGCYDLGTAASNTATILYNTFYINGQPTSGAARSAAMFSNSNTNIRVFRNNLFVNERSNNGATGSHYALFYNYAVNTNLTADFNNLYTSGSGGYLVYYNANLADLDTYKSTTGVDYRALSVNPGFVSAGGLSTGAYVPQNSLLLAGVLAAVTTDFNGTARNAIQPTMGAFEISIDPPVQVWKSGVYQKGYTILGDAFIDINAGVHTGVLDVKLYSSVSEPTSASLNASGSGSASYSSVVVYPVASNLTVSGKLSAPLINLNGADNVIIDGRLNASGAANNLTIINNSTAATAGTNTIRMINDASNNTIKYCTLQGASTSADGGIVSFSTTSGSTGNDNNILEYCDFKGISVSLRPSAGVYSLGTVSKENSGTIIRNNSFYDLFRPTAQTASVNLSTNTNDFYIQNNHFYETSLFTTTGANNYYFILVNSPSATSFNISGNSIGGTASAASGTALTKTGGNNPLYLINCTIAAAGNCTIQNNVLRNINWTNSSTASFSCIQTSSGIYSITDNVIGATTGTGSLTLTSTGSVPYFYGIYTSGTSTCTVQRNSIGSVLLVNASTNSHNFYGIYGAGTANIISDNLVGSETTPNSIYASSTGTSSSQYVYGIYQTGANVTISNNVISNLNNGSTNTGTAASGICGIRMANTGSVVNNIVKKLTTGCNYGNYSNTSPVMGIMTEGSYQRTISGNQIYELSSTNASYTGGVLGIFLLSPTSGTTDVSNNFIHSLSAASATARIMGIHSSTGNARIANNVISLGGDINSLMYGFYSNTAAYTQTLYHNTITLNGQPASGTSSSYAMYSETSTTILSLKNNIFTNYRSNNGGTGSHYAIYYNYSSNTNLTADFNNYYSNGSGAVMARYGSNYNSILDLQVANGRDARSMSVDPGFLNAVGTQATDYVPSNSTLLAGLGVGVTTDYAGTTRSLIAPAMGAFEIAVSPIVQTWKGGVYQAGYTTVKDAFSDINNGVVTGNLEVRLYGSTYESSSAVLNASGTGSANYSAVLLYPTIDGLSIAGNIAAPLIDLNGADNVIVDGRVGATGSAKSLNLINYSTSTTDGTSTIRFINDACNNTLKYCTVKGSATAGSCGNVFFSTSTGTIGNDNNIIENNDLTSATLSARARYVVFAYGSATAINSNNTIRNNKFYDFFNANLSSSAIHINAYNESYTIDSNHFFATTTIVPSSSGEYDCVFVNAGGLLGNFSVTNNYFGGQAPYCGGGAFTKSNASSNTFYAVQISTASTTITNYVSGNTISNISWSNSSSSSFYGIYTNGAAEIKNNVIGASTGTGNILYTPSGNALLYAIQAVGTGVPITIDQNTIGAITAGNVNSTTYTNFYGIYAYGSSPVISNNIIGSNTTPNSISSICSSSSNAQSVYAIYLTGANATITGNTIANITNGTTNVNTVTTGMLVGMYLSSSCTVTDNSIHDLTISNANNNSRNYNSLTGILLFNSVQRILTGNRIYNLTNNFNGFAGVITGISVEADGSASNLISHNFIHSLSAPSAVAAGRLYGIHTYVGNVTYTNNIISLGGDAPCTIYGVYELGAASTTNSFFHNTISIHGSPTAGASNSYALYSANNVNVRKFSNNIFLNTRSNNGATGTHFAVTYNYSSTTNLTSDYNTLYVAGNGTVLAYFSSPIPVFSTLQSSRGIELHSFNMNPSLTSLTGTNASDYITAVKSLLGDRTLGVNLDFGSNSRTVYTMGAWEVPVTAWVGSLSTDWNNAGNWSTGTIPAAGEDIYFIAMPYNHCFLDQNRAIGSLYNAQSTYRMVTNGYTLSVNGAFNLTNSASVEASAIGSTVLFNGNSTQTIPAASFYNNNAYNISINNPANVTLYGTLNLAGQLTSSSGQLDATSQSPTVVYNGTASQTIEDGTYLNNQLYNTTIANTVGVLNTADLTINNNLIINASGKLNVASLNTLQVNGSLTNAAGNTGLLLLSDATGTASLIHNTNNVPATVQRYISGAADNWHLVSSPVQQQTVFEASNWTPVGTHGDGTGYDLYVWDEPTSCWIYNLNTTVAPTWSSVHPQSYFVPGRGYLYANQAPNPTNMFRGNLNNGVVNYTLTANALATGKGDYKGFNLIGNPYPSSIDWKADAGFVRSMLYQNGSGYDVWIWNPAANNYGVFNSASTLGTNGVTQYIAPEQAFFVRAVTGGTFSFNNAARTHQEAGSWKAPREVPACLSVSVEAMNGAGSDEVLFNFDTSSPRPGALKFYSPLKTSPSLFFVDSLAYSTYHLPDTVGAVILPIRVLAGMSGSFRLSAACNDERIRTVIVLDRELGKYTLLTKDATYDFCITGHEDIDRLYVYINRIPAELGMTTIPVYSVTEGLLVDLSGLDKHQFRIRIIDTCGRLITERYSLNSLETFSLRMRGVYIVQVTDGLTTRQYKVLY